MNPRLQMAIFLVGITLFSFAVSGAETADLIYHRGEIVTMDDAHPAAEAVAVRLGRILAVGNSAEILKFQGNSTTVIDLDGKTLLPGFIDPHSHLAQYQQTWGIPALAPPPVGDVRTIADIIAKMRAYIVKKKIPPGELVLGNGYDDSLLAELRHPTRSDLDQISQEHPVLLVHASGHFLTGNSLALAAVKYDRETKDPLGGVIRREANGDPNGVCEELAGLPFFQLLKPNPLQKQLENLIEIQELYARHGVTTAQDGISMGPEIQLLREAANRGELFLDIVSYPRWDLFNDVLSGQRKLDIEYHSPLIGCCQMNASGTRPVMTNPIISDKSKLQVGIYQNHLKFAGIKITADGSPQGKTAFLTKPYVNPPPGQSKDYRGYATVTQDELDRWFDVAYLREVQLIVHCNGDAAADMMIAAARKAIRKHGKKDLRPVMIHAQMIRHDQVDAMDELGIIPSFFTGHTFFWGDWHLKETVGPERAFGMSPAAYAVKKGMRFTNHTDAPIIPPDPLIALWTAVNRVSRSGVVVGPNERISALDGLKAMTIHAAYQYFEESTKGSIEPGKLADFVILDKNPLTVPPMTIKDIKVTETIKQGVKIYSSQD